MRWQIGDYSFDADTKRLRGEGREQVLEPKAAALLVYFCQNARRDIGRDELLETVWHGQVVTDNTISRAIVLLRKALGDDDKARRYIVTVPKLGYRLIAAVSPADANPTTAVRLRRTTPAYRVALLGVGIALVAGLLVSWRPSPTVGNEARPGTVPLSRLAVAQSNADLAADGQGLVYTAFDGSHNRIYYIDGPDAEPVAVSAPDIDANFATWAHSGAFIVYQVMDDTRCEVHRLTRAQFSSGVADVVYQCIPGGYTELSLSPDDTALYFVERATPHSPYAVVALDLAGREKRRLSQPVARGYGNHFVDVHPARGTLLVLSDHAPGKTSVYELDPANDAFTLRRTFDYGLDSAIFSHRDGYIVHPSRHPSYQLLESSLATADSRVLVSDSRRIASPRRIRASESDYLFTSYLYNRDIAYARFATEAINSTVMDYLPAISHSGEQLAFVSKRSGDSQIWVKDYRDGRLTQIAPPDAGRRFLDLAWSADDRRLLANTNTGILVYALGEARFSHDIALAAPAYAVHWHDAGTLGFSHFEEERWQAYRHVLASGETELLDRRWAFSLVNEYQQLRWDQTLTAYRDGEPLPALADCAGAVWRYQLRVQLDGEAIYCHANDRFADLLRFDADMDRTRLPDAVRRFEFYSVRGGHIASTRVASAHSDIMRTRSQD